MRESCTEDDINRRVGVGPEAALQYEPMSDDRSDSVIIVSRCHRAPTGTGKRSGRPGSLISVVVHPSLGPFSHPVVAAATADVDVPSDKTSPVSQ